MSADVVQNEVTKIVIIEERLEPLGSFRASDHKGLVVAVAFGVAGGILLLLVLFLICRRRRKRRKLRRSGATFSNSTLTTTASPIYSINKVPTEVQLRTTEDVARRYERSVSSLSTKSQIYLVPFEVLPPNFDFSSREVEVKADYVILKDLKLLERYSPSNDDGGVVNRAYDPQESYNPYFNRTIPSIPSLIEEPYKKQTSYNPTFY